MGRWTRRCTCSADARTACAARGVELKWFGADEPHGYTSRHQSWRYAGEQHAPRTDVILKRLFDMRVPLTFSEDDCAQIAALIVDSIAETLGKS